MKFQIGQGGYPVGQYLIPAGTVVDYNGTSDWDKLAQRAGPPPLNAIALDSEGYEAMRRHYINHRHLLQRGF